MKAEPFVSGAFIGAIFGALIAFDPTRAPDVSMWMRVLIIGLIALTAGLYTWGQEVGNRCPGGHIQRD